MLRDPEKPCASWAALVETCPFGVLRTSPLGQAKVLPTTRRFPSPPRHRSRRRELLSMKRGAPLIRGDLATLDGDVTAPVCAPPGTKHRTVGNSDALGPPAPRTQHRDTRQLQPKKS